MMLAMTAHALSETAGSSFETPTELVDRLLPRVREYGGLVTGRPDLHKAFSLNALVPVDNAAWMLYAAENGLKTFDDIIPAGARPALSHRHKRVVSMPAVGYGMSIENIVRLVRDGFYVLKIKIGSDPAKDGDPEKMLAWDQERMRAIHAAVGALDAPGSETGRVMYYLDANQRYDGKDRVMRLLDYLKQIGAMDQVILLEEPFSANDFTDVRGIPAVIVADESAATDKGARNRMDLGYGAIALKPVAKTLSMAFRIVQLAHERRVPCFCADLTVNPVMVDWNKNLAARLAPVPGLNGGALEVNGWQNYARWETMQTWHAGAGAAWTEPRQGAYHLDDEFYAESAGILRPPEHYLRLVKPAVG
jgi:hypothetical protein